MAELSPSATCELGKKEFWDQFYSTELENFEDHGDTGDIWFGKKNLDRIVSWLEKNKVEKSARILDVGCGNGLTLICLARSGFEKLTGVDYSEEAVQLAQKIAESKNIKANLLALDFLNPGDSDKYCSRDFNIIIDKGTYDAICLDVEHIEEKRKQYMNKILKLLSSNGYFILFSCNWTKDELQQHFKDFCLYDEIDIPSISYGGKTGQTITALVMKKSDT